MVDMPTRYNSDLYRGSIQTSIDASTVAILRAAGALILGKTHTTEFAATTAGGPCVNPHNTSHTPGGSSSGSAAAVADFHAPISLGTQTGGSVVRPASYNGVYGFKVSTLPLYFLLDNADKIYSQHGDPSLAKASHSIPLPATRRDFLRAASKTSTSWRAYTVSLMTSPSPKSPRRQDRIRQDACLAAGTPQSRSAGRVGEGEIPPDSAWRCGSGGGSAARGGGLCEGDGVA
jgi:Asp-tRNA(Asn)/Glu-tRNA(Gln) amidotransferase A subunit family amidase